MNKQILECLRGEEGKSYIFPFLWLHGEPQDRVKEEILAIKNSGISEFCAECRPYDNFCREQWWDDFGFILKTARELDMKVWLLDDRKFPTGYANGYLEAPEHAALRKKMVRERQSTVVGPAKNIKIDAGAWLERDCEKIISVIAYRHVGKGEALDYTSATDLTDTLRDGVAYWSAPEGIWRVCITIETRMNRPNGHIKNFYIDMLDKDSCHAMIDAIYQPHYEHFSEYFGNTFRGFFSDEPGFVGLENTYFCKLGSLFEYYPWRNDLVSLISESSGMSEREVSLALPALWEDLGEISSAIRMHYMEVVTKLYRDNFSRQLGNWCREHGVMYIGHVIEDRGADMRLSLGAGHYFRALDGQDMGGIDIVLHQDIPGVSEATHRGDFYEGGEARPAFFRYTLPKLCASYSHIHEQKQGRAMCEIFGAFGWAAGLPYMKGLADIMLARGINHFVPHAFSCREEDPDCPPHFYNGGKNIQYPTFKKLMGYMSRCSHVLYGSRHCADVAVFYNAEGEWSGNNQVFHYVCEELSRSLIDFDIIPYDYLIDATVRNGRLYVGDEDYGALVVSKSEKLPRTRLECFGRLSAEGLPIIFTDELPSGVAEGGDASVYTEKFDVVALEGLSSYIREAGLAQISTSDNGTEELCFYHARRDGEDIYVFSNENIRKAIDVTLKLSQGGECLIYEPWENKCYRGAAEEGKLRLCIEGGNMLMMVFGGDIPDGIPEFRSEVERKNMKLRFDISLRNEGEREFVPYVKDSELIDISAPDRFPNFSGEVLYQTKIRADRDFTVLDLGEVGEIAEVWLNGRCLGTRINSPYKFSLANALQEGDNELNILVKSNLGHRRRDAWTRYIHIPPTGIMGDIALCRYEDIYK